MAGSIYLASTAWGRQYGISLSATSWTYSGWIEVAATTYTNTAEQYRIMLEVDLANDNWYAFYTDSTNDQILFGSNETGAIVVASGANTSWIYYRMVRNGTNLLVEVSTNGISFTTVASFTISSSNLFGYWVNNWYPGDIPCFAYYRSIRLWVGIAFSQAQSISESASAVPVITTNLRGGYADGATPVAATWGTDINSSGNNLTLTGTAVYDASDPISSGIVVSCSTAILRSSIVPVDIALSVSSSLIGQRSRVVEPTILLGITSSVVVVRASTVDDAVASAASSNAVKQKLILSDASCGYASQTDSTSQRLLSSDSTLSQVVVVSSETTRTRVSSGDSIELFSVGIETVALEYERRDSNAAFALTNEAFITRVMVANQDSAWATIVGSTSYEQPRSNSSSSFATNAEATMHRSNSSDANSTLGSVSDPFSLRALFADSSAQLVAAAFATSVRIREAFGDNVSLLVATVETGHSNRNSSNVDSLFGSVGDPFYLRTAPSDSVALVASVSFSVSTVSVLSRYGDSSTSMQSFSESVKLAATNQQSDLLFSVVSNDFKQRSNTLEPSIRLGTDGSFEIRNSKSDSAGAYTSTADSNKLRLMFEAVSSEISAIADSVSSRFSSSDNEVGLVAGAVSVPTSSSRLASTESSTAMQATGEVVSNRVKVREAFTGLAVFEVTVETSGLRVVFAASKTSMAAQAMTASARLVPVEDVAQTVAVAIATNVVAVVEGENRVIVVVEGDSRSIVVV